MAAKRYRLKYAELKKVARDANAFGVIRKVAMVDIIKFEKFYGLNKDNEDEILKGLKRRLDGK